MLVQAEVVKLDRGFPLVRLPDGTELRCEHATNLKKGKGARAVIGDEVVIDLPEGHEKAIIAEILPRRRELVRKDPAERTAAQVLAANFDVVIIAQPLNDVNLRRMERELVLAHETGAAVCVVLTKADLAAAEAEAAAAEAEAAAAEAEAAAAEAEGAAAATGDGDGGAAQQHARPVRPAQTVQQVVALAGPDVTVLEVSQEDPGSIAAVRRLVAPGTTAVLIGRSGVGKSSLVNMLVGRDVLATGSVREGDGKGRHTTVSREIVEIPGGGRVVDMPGVRGLGMWEADAGIGAAFADVEALAAQCKFRDCRHEGEPGCAVQAAVAAGELAPERAESYRSLKQETRAVRTRKRESSWRKH